MANSTSLEKQVDQLFAALNAKHGDSCRNPVTGVGFVWGSIQSQCKRLKRFARFTQANGLRPRPSDAPTLPLSHEMWKTTEMREV